MKKYLLLFLGLISFLTLNAQTAADDVQFRAFLKFAEAKKLVDLPMGERVAKVGQFFVGSPYVGSTLEAPGEERLQCNLLQFDCNTFVENVLSLSVLLDADQKDWFHFKQILEVLRYRDGYVHGYPSRLHYASEWLHDNVAMVFFDWIRVPDLEQLFKPNVSYMSTHPSAYPALKSDTSLLAEIKSRENEINTWTLYSIPKAKITAKSAFLKSGDIVAITTNTAGLDFSHMGIVIRKKDKVYLMHASSTEKKVVVSNITLSKYLAGIKKHTGIVAVRPK